MFKCPVPRRELDSPVVGAASISGIFVKIRFDLPRIVNKFPILANFETHYNQGGPWEVRCKAGGLGGVDFHLREGSTYLPRTYFGISTPSRVFSCLSTIH